MKYFACLLIMVGVNTFAFSQTEIEKSVATKPNQKVYMAFRFPKIINIKTWDKNEIKVKASVSINKGQNDDSFELELESNGNRVEINSRIKGYKNLPKKIVIMKDGTEYFFNTSNWNSMEVRKFMKQHGEDGYQYSSHGVIKDIYIDIMVPENVVLDIDSEFGMIEIVNFQNQLSAKSKFGGIDISVEEKTKTTLLTGTRFGDVYSNLNAPFTSKNEKVYTHGKWDLLTCKIKGGGVMQEIESEFGNIYIRKNE